MLHYSQNDLDDLDKHILEILQSNGRINNAELARRINLSPPATHARVKRLETHGYIETYTAILNRDRAGYDMLCFIHVTLQTHQPEDVARFREAILQMPEVLECHHVTGEFDYLLRVVIHNRSDLERFVVHRLTPIPGLGRIYTSLVLSEIKATTILPLDHPDDDD